MMLAIQDLQNTLKALTDGKNNKTLIKEISLSINLHTIDAKSKFKLPKSTQVMIIRLKIA